MLRRSFVQMMALSALAPAQKPLRSEKLAQAAMSQVGVTTSYDPRYTSIPYPNGDVPRTTGVCADVIVRAYRDALALDLQALVHEDMANNFVAYPKAWGNRRTDTNIDHRRVLNLETFWRRKGAQLWAASGTIAGNAFPAPVRQGDVLTWLLGGKLPHVGVVVSVNGSDVQVVHNIGEGAQLISLDAFNEQHAKGHFRWQIA